MRMEEAEFTDILKDKKLRSIHKSTAWILEETWKLED